MANKFPVTVNVQQQVFEELPINDNLDLTGCGIYDGVSTGTPGQVLKRISTGNEFRWEDDKTNELKVLSVVTNNVPAAGVVDFTIQPGNIYCLLNIATTFPAWIRVYDTADARSADIRTIPGAPYPPAGSGFYTEIVTSTPNQQIRLSPIPTCQSIGGLSYIRLINMDTVTRSIESTFNVLTLY